jgi:hypothetical protein
LKICKYLIKIVSRIKQNLSELKGKLKNSLEDLFLNFPQLLIETETRSEHIENLKTMIKKLGIIGLYRTSLPKPW